MYIICVQIKGFAVVGKPPVISLLSAQTNDENASDFLNGELDIVIHYKSDDMQVFFFFFLAGLPHFGLRKKKRLPQLFSCFFFLFPLFFCDCVRCPFFVLFETQSFFLWMFFFFI